MMLFGSITYGIASICVVFYTFCRDEKTSLITAASLLVGFGGKCFVVHETRPFNYWLGKSPNYMESLKQLTLSTNLKSLRRYI